MAQACVLDRDPACVQLALDRVFAKRRPSHDGQVKDSIHLEHYLELSRLLQAGGFAERRVFVSGNRSDFWDGPLPRIHTSIEPDLIAVGLEFFGDLRSAVGSLRIRTPSTRWPGLPLPRYVEPTNRLAPWDAVVACSSPGWA